MSGTFRCPCGWTGGRDDVGQAPLEEYDTHIDVCPVCGKGPLIAIKTCATCKHWACIPRKRTGVCWWVHTFWGGLAGKADRRRKPMHANDGCGDWEKRDE